MASYSSWHGTKVHAHRGLLTDLLKRELGFDGPVVSDYLALDQVDPDPLVAAVRCLSAGVDVVMVPFDHERFRGVVREAVVTGQLPLARLDDAVRRLLRAKQRLGLLPLDGAPQVLLAGAAADDVGLACGGWTITWDGGPGPITTGSTLLAGLQEHLGPRVHLLDDAALATVPEGPPADVGVVTVHEPPYAEGRGDREQLTVEPEQLELLRAVASRCRRVVLVGPGRSGRLPVSWPGPVMPRGRPARS